MKLKRRAPCGSITAFVVYFDLPRLDAIAAKAMIDEKEKTRKIVIIFLFINLPTQRKVKQKKRKDTRCIALQQLVLVSVGK
jgi:hypothetical protein